jgi:hypothetical protein
MRTLLLFVVALVSGPAFAYTEYVDPTWSYDGHVTKFPNLGAACVQLGANNNISGATAGTMSGTAPGRTGNCRGDLGNGQISTFGNVLEGCPSTHGPNTSLGLCQREVAECPPGQVPNQAGICVPNECGNKVGQSTIENYTTGWAQSNNPDTAKAINVPLPFDGACDGSCQVAYGGVDSCKWSQVPSPANGLHRVSCDVRMTYTGATCSARTASGDPGTPEPPCPGLLAKVDGKPVCVGTAGAPLPSIPKSGDGTPPSTPGNPSAGPVPTTGPGSGSDGPGRTPTVGNGGNEGGGSNASIPGGGSEGNGQGTGTPSPTNPDGSGTSGGTPGHGQEVDVDESGMPSGAGAFDGATAGVNANRDAAVAGINAAAGASGKVTSWSFTFALPTGCSPIPMGGYEPYLTGINICEWQPQIHDLMSMAWLAAAVFLCIGMVGRAIGGGSA